MAIPPREYFLGFSRKFEQAILGKPVDVCIYDIRKFISLAADCNPNIIEVLWVDDADVLFCSRSGKMLRAERESFLSQKAKHTFSGYALSQLKRIKTHRRWLLAPPTAPPTRAEYSLPETRLLSKDALGAAEAEVRKLVDSWELDLSMLDDVQRLHLTEQVARVIAERTRTPSEEQAARLIGFQDDMMQYLDRERRYNAAAREWEQYQIWKKNRNPVRAELEARYGYDAKHAMHLVRLLRMCREILEQGKVLVRRPDAEELLSIRNGAWSYDRLIEYAEREDVALTEVMRASRLPKSPPRERLDELCIELVQSALYGGRIKETKNDEET